MTLLKTVAILLALGSISAATIQNKCLPLFTGSNSVAFDLNSVNPTNAQTPLTVVGAGSSSQFVLCNPIPSSALNADWKCTPVSGSIAYIYDTASTTCKALNSEDSIINSAINMDSDQKVSGVTLSYDNSNASATDKPNLYGKNLQIVMNCDANIQNQNAAWTYTENDKYVVFSSASSAGCGNSLKDLFGIFEKYRIVSSIVLGAFGVLFAFFGKKLFTITLTLCGFLTGFLSIAGVAYAFSALQNADSKKVTVILILSTLLGILLAYIFYKFKKVTTMVALGFLFFFIGNAILRLYLVKLNLANWIQIVILIVIVGLGVTGGYLFSEYKYCNYSNCIIFATSLGGAFLLIMSIGFLTQTLKTPAEIQQMVLRNENMVHYGLK